MSVDRTLPVFDADQHYYEPVDAFTRYLPAGWSERTVQMAEIDGRKRFVVGGTISEAVSNPTFDPIVKPGAMSDFFRGNPEKKTLKDCLSEREPIPDYYRVRDARINKLDEQNVQACWLLPTIGMSFEENLQFDPAACGVAFHAYNEWLLDDWGFVYQDRIYTAPYLAMGDIDAATREVEWALNNGTRLFTTRPTGVYTVDGWKSPGDTCFDPIWARINEAGVTVIPHIAEVGGYGLDRFVSHAMNIIGKPAPPLQIIVGHERPPANYTAALVADLLFERFPNLRIASVENGAGFLPQLLPGLRRVQFQRPDYFKVDPVEAFKQHVWVNPFWEDILEEAVDLIGADRVLFGSDYPHPEGLANPRDYQTSVDKLNDPVSERQIMYENSAGLTTPI